MEYRVELLAAEPIKAQSMLNEYGAAGWELKTALLLNVPRPSPVAGVSGGMEVVLYCILCRHGESWGSSGGGVLTGGGEVGLLMPGGV